MVEADEMGVRSHIHIAYDGPALQAHRMDVKELAPALLAFGELVERANELLNEDRAKIRVEVRASFKEGSFGIDLEVVQSLTGWLLNAIQDNRVQSAKEILEWLGMAGGAGWSALKIIRKLRGRSLEQFELLPDGRGVAVIDGEQLTVEREVLRIVSDYKVRKCFEQLIAKPLADEGVDSFAVVDREQGEVLVYVGDEEARYFAAPPDVRQDSSYSEIDTLLQVVGLSFVEGSKWRFTDGDSTFNAAILSKDFQRRIDAREEQFTKGDTLKVRLGRQQTISASGKLKVEYSIVEVYEHLKSWPQFPLALPDKPEDG